MMLISPKDNDIYFLPDRYFKKTIVYPNVNADPKLRKSVTLWFHKKLLQWLNNNNDFKKFKKYYKKINTKTGIKKLYNVIRYYVKKTDCNWYDLKEQHYEILKDYILLKMKHII